MRPINRKYHNTKSQSSARGKKMAFILSRFPLVDETFILREMTALADDAFEFDIYSLKKPGQAVIQKAALKLMPAVIYRRYFWSRELLAAQIYFLRRAAPTYLRTLLIFVMEMWNRPQILSKCFILFPKAVCYARLMQRRQVAHIHAFWATFPCTMAWIAHRLIGVPYSFSAHAHDIYEDDSMLVRKLRESEFVMTCTQYNHAFLSKLVPEKMNAIKLIYHGQDLEPFREDAQRQEAPSDIFRILSIGTFYKTKGFDTLVEACAALKQQGFLFQCKIVGDGPERKRLERLLATHALQDQVIMLGYLTQEEIRPLRRWADVFILLPRPYLHWGLPNVFIEALAAKIAVIATPLNAIGELIKHDQTGLIVESDNPPAAAAALMRLSREPELRERLAMAGQKLAFQLFDARRTSQEVCNLFAEKLGRRQKPAKPISRNQTSLRRGKGYKV